MKMNQKQRDHASQRIRDILDRRLQALEEECTTPGKELTPQERWELLKTGAVPLDEHRGRRVELYDRVYDVFDWSLVEYKKKVDKIRFLQLAEPLRARARVVIDNIMLGTGSEALDLIAAFEREMGERE